MTIPAFFDFRTRNDAAGGFFTNLSDSTFVKKKVVFICTGNICRSPMAEGLFAALVRERDDYEVCSAGLAAGVGHPASAHTLSVLKEDDIDLTYFRSRPLDQKLARDATHLFVMTKSHADMIDRYFPYAAEKTYLVTEFCSDDQLRGQDIIDPYGLDRDAYLQTRADLKKALPSLVAFIEQTFTKNE